MQPMFDLIISYFLSFFILKLKSQLHPQFHRLMMGYKLKLHFKYSEVIKGCMRKYLDILLYHKMTVHGYFSNFEWSLVSIEVVVLGILSLLGVICSCIYPEFPLVRSFPSISQLSHVFLFRVQDLNHVLCWYLFKF